MLIRAIDIFGSRLCNVWKSSDLLGEKTKGNLWWVRRWTKSICSGWVFGHANNTRCSIGTGLADYTLRIWWMRTQMDSKLSHRDVKG